MPSSSPGPWIDAVVHCCLRSDRGIIHSSVHRERQDNQLPDGLLPDDQYDTRRLGEYIPVLTTVYDYSVFKLLGDIGKTRIDGGDLPALLLVPLLTIVVSGLLGVLVFRKKEIK